MRDKQDMVTIVAEEFAATLASFAVEPRHIADITQQVEDRLRLRIGGDALYACKVDRDKRRAAVLAEFNGRNIDELAKRHKLSPRRIRQMVREERDLRGRL